MGKREALQMLFLSSALMWGIFVAGAADEVRKEQGKVCYRMMCFPSTHDEESSQPFIFFEPDKCQFFLPDYYAVVLII